MEEILKIQSLPYVPSLPNGQTLARAFILIFVRMILYTFTTGSIHRRSFFLDKAILVNRLFIHNILGETYFNITYIHVRVHQGVRNHRVTLCLRLHQAWLNTHLSKTGRLLNIRHHPGLFRRISYRVYLPN